MSKKMLTVSLTVLLSLLCASVALAHAGGHGAQADGLRVWTNAATGEQRDATLLFVRAGQVHLERHDGRRVSWPLAQLAESDRAYVAAQQTRIAKLNAPLEHTTSLPPVWLALLALLVGASGLWLYRCTADPAQWRIAFACAALLFCSLTYAKSQQAQTRPAQTAAFDVFSPKVTTRWDDKYFYVESNGIPEHPLMVGIKTWQQQVPVAQPYFSENAWSIPLNPVPAAQPVSAKTALFTGAIALAANGVPIFNALNNRGVDSFSIGELDDYGGHCGRADDYHYHAAPLHLQTKLGPSLPIGYALDGYPLYGLKEPNGDTVTGLDEFNGHSHSSTDGGKYHYHSTLTYPYINGGMHGQVTVSNDQIVPQPRAFSVRPATTPLTGAAITAWRANSATSWTLEYQINRQTYKINYSTNGSGQFAYEFVDPAGNKRTENYTRRGAGGNVSAASYNGSVAADSIAAMFGAGLASATRAAASVPLPTNLNGTSLRIVDALGVARLAPLFFDRRNR